MQTEAINTNDISLNLKSIKHDESDGRITIEFDLLVHKDEKHQYHLEGSILVREGQPTTEYVFEYDKTKIKAFRNRGHGFREVEFLDGQSEKLLNELKMVKIMSPYLLTEIELEASKFFITLEKKRRMNAIEQV
ncbi:hypothetical protein EAY39_15175 [Vibrio anguillarum]|uniref:hypothetical protein n=2 Tax=Vibrio anguillarum TaxID=55601 RepID=UPI0018C27F5C|nr:hypothetical protein [Vibrio anguillarum]MBF4342105.1 hypothetical protein [Vibrio anguillarum]